MDKGDQYVEPALRVSRLETRSLAAEAQVRPEPVLLACCSSAECLAAAGPRRWCRLEAVKHLRQLQVSCMHSTVADLDFRLID